MKKSEIARQFDFKATSFFMFAAFALAINSVLTNITSNFEINAVLNIILVCFLVLFSVFADVMTIKGFITVNKSCKLNEENQNYYMGKKLTVLTVVFIVIGVILTIVALMMSILIAQYDRLEMLTAADKTARMNMLVITAIINIILQLTAISTPYIIYVWKLRPSIPAKDKLNNFALLTVIILVVQLAIGILNSIYVVRNSDNSFLTAFSEILSVVKYIVLAVFFFVRRRNLASTVVDE